MKASRLERGAPHVKGAAHRPNCVIRSRTPKPANAILVIDCEAQVRRFVCARLKLYGYSVSQAENGSEGLNAVAHIRPDVIILDPALPDMSGIEVLQTIRRSRHCAVD
jgi:CheY-like chemotaxis protein